MQQIEEESGHQRPNCRSLPENLSPEIGNGGRWHHVSKFSGAGFFRKLIAALEALDTNTPVRVEVIHGMARFTVAQSGSLLVELPLQDEVDRP